ncbi:MAG TPA: MMPL family transporter [Spirochaetota bacterium]|nr:MAG: MMPL family protein [Spirochaetes bacterium ADurb.Bin133]HNZ27400.1 MMPL family transporter [Spirochaetota bacterium]HOF00174.1 MMPL family transporter [Spirochaetota bacterium]HOS32939.1 MMPL family transporter [Spirochaetota bacterium]HOS54895.1 MMPL family transporter [Spirochaetota bacterium]
MLNFKDFFDKKLIFSLILGVISIVIIIFSTKLINFNSSLQNLFPPDEDMTRSASLMEKSPVSDKVVLFINNDAPEKLPSYINKFKQLIDQSEINFTNTIPSDRDVAEVMEYCQRNSLLLYPYESKDNPFTSDNIKKGFETKAAYIENMPFFNPDEYFFMDPLSKGLEVLKTINSTGQNKFNSKYGGILNNDGTSFMLVLKSGIAPNDYDNSEAIVELDKNVKALSNELKCKAFILSSHLYYQESYHSIQFETSIMFIVSTLLTLIIFFFFFRDIKILYYSILPMLLGISLTFLCIAIFKRNFGGVAFGFGSTILGISSDYTVHYLVKRQICKNMEETEDKIGKALVIGFITTIAPLAILPLSGIVSLQEIAFLGILSVGFSFIFTWFLLRRLAPPGDSCETRLYNFKYLGFKGFIAFIILFLPLLIAVFFLKFEDNISNLDMVHHEMNRRVEKIKNSFNYTADATMLCFSGDTKDEVLSKSLKALYHLEKSGAPGFLTPAIFAPDAETLKKRKIFIKENFNALDFKNELKNSIFEENSFDAWENSVKNIDNVALSALPTYVENEINSMFVDYEGKIYLVIPIQSRQNFKEIETELKNGDLDFFTIDLMRDNAPRLLKFEKIAALALLISLAVIIIILLIAYRNILYAASALIPALTGLIACFGISPIIGKSINIMHIVASMILIGICVDYGVFVTSSYKDYHGEEGINITFLSILICALITLAGFGALMISSNQAIFTLGVSVFFGIVFSFLSSWFVIPFLMKNKKN